MLSRAKRTVLRINARKGWGIGLNCASCLMRISLEFRKATARIASAIMGWRRYPFKAAGSYKESKNGTRESKKTYLPKNYVEFCCEHCMMIRIASFGSCGA